MANYSFFSGITRFFKHFVFMILLATQSRAYCHSIKNSESLRLDGDSKAVVGAFYFGVFNNSFREAYKGYIQHWPIDVQQRPQIWWYGVEDLYKKQGTAYQELINQDPTFDTFHLRPAIGFHNNSETAVLEQHIDQAANGGLDYFNFYWYWSKAAKTEVMQEGLYAFKQAKNKNRLKFQITLFFHSWDPDHNLNANDTSVAVDQMINHVRDPQYLKIDGRPVITIGDGRNIKNGKLSDLQDMMGYIRYRFNLAQVGNPVIMIHPGAVDDWNLSRPDGFQCLVPSPGLIINNGNYKTFVDDHSQFFKLMRDQGLPFSSCVASGFDERPRYKVFIDRLTDLRVLKNFSMTEFDRALNAAVQSAVVQSNAASKLLNVYAWNEWHEGGIIEPTEKNGTLFLETIESNLKTKPLNLFTDSENKKIASAALSINGYSKVKSWRLFSEFRHGQSRKSALYECKITGHNSPFRFLSGDVNCEGQTNVNGSLPIGFVLNSTDGSRLPLKLIYRCNNQGNFHFASDSLDCEKQNGQNIINEGPLGYVPL